MFLKKYLNFRPEKFKKLTMKIKFKVMSLLILSSLVYQNTISQSKTQSEPLQSIIYNDNVKDPLSIKELDQIKEVYGENSESDILSKPQRIKDVKNILRNRIEIFDAGDKDLSSLPKLSTVELFDDYIPSISRDFNFHPKNFNPLKYKFNFYSRNSSTYHVDGTRYCIIIKSQHQ